MSADQENVAEETVRVPVLHLRMRGSFYSCLTAFGHHTVSDPAEKSGDALFDSPGWTTGWQPMPTAISVRIHLGCSRPQVLSLLQPANTEWEHGGLHEEYLQ